MDDVNAAARQAAPDSATVNVTIAVVKSCRRAPTQGI
jgi:hypothetical protein